MARRFFSYFQVLTGSIVNVVSNCVPHFSLRNSTSLCAPESLRERYRNSVFPIEICSMTQDGVEVVVEVFFWVWIWISTAKRTSYSSFHCPISTIEFRSDLMTNLVWDMKNENEEIDEKWISKSNEISFEFSKPVLSFYDSRRTLMTFSLPDFEVIWQIPCEIWNENEEIDGKWISKSLSLYLSIYLSIYLSLSMDSIAVTNLSDICKMKIGVSMYPIDL